MTVSARAQLNDVFVLKDVFVSTNVAVLEPAGEPERIVLFDPRLARPLRRELGNEIQAVLEGLRMLQWRPLADARRDGARPTA
jgi:hypothetical protein